MNLHHPFIIISAMLAMAACLILGLLNSSGTGAGSSTSSAITSCR